jgi:hypothetical protein
VLGSDECNIFSHRGDWPRWTIFEVLVLIVVGGIIILGGEIDGHAISVSAFLGLATLFVWLASTLAFSKLIDLTRLMCIGVAESLAALFFSLDNIFAVGCSLWQKMSEH